MQTPCVISSPHRIQNKQVRKAIYILLLYVFALVSCDYTGYETGSGEYSNLRADYADIKVTQGMVTGITTDDGTSLTPPSGLQYKENKDTIIRCLLYYNMQDISQPIQVVGQKNVNVIIPLKWESQEKAKNDPLTLTAAWMSANKRYINMQVGLKNGSKDEEAMQTLVIRCDSVSTYKGGAIWLTLCHDQGGIPQYYTKDILLSIPTKLLPDTIHLTTNTYSGQKTHLFTK